MIIFSVKVTCRFDYSKTKEILNFHNKKDIFKLQKTVLVETTFIKCLQSVYNILSQRRKKIIFSDKKKIWILSRISFVFL